MAEPTTCALPAETAVRPPSSVRRMDLVDWAERLLVLTLYGWLVIRIFGGYWKSGELADLLLLPSEGVVVVFLLLRHNAITTLDSMCTLPNRGCPAEAQSTYDKGRTYNLLANVTLGAGAVGVGVGTILFFTQKKPKTATSIGAVPGAQGSALGATVVGSF